MAAKYQQLQQPNTKDSHQLSKTIRRALLILNFTMMVIGAAGSPLILRLYFLHGGKSKWTSAWLQTVGFPLILLPLSISYSFHSKNQNPKNTKPVLVLITPKIVLASAFVGIITAANNFMYAFGLSYLPVSTSSLLISIQLCSTAFFAFLLVRQKFTPFSVNAVALLTFGALVLGLDQGKDKPKGETIGQYYVGFFMTLGGALLYGVVPPMVELIYTRAKQTVTYTLVMEMQFVIGCCATAFCTVCMIFNKDFQAMPMEAEQFGLGESTYYLVLVCSAIMWQFFYLGAAGAIFYGSALLLGIINAALIPVTEVLAVIFLDEPFSEGKGISLALSSWGFVSYFCGEYKEHKRNKAIGELEQNLGGSYYWIA